MTAGNQYSIARVLIQSLIHCYLRGHSVKCLLLMSTVDKNHKGSTDVP